MIASPLKSALAISPTCWPDNSSTAPFWLVSTIAREPLPTASPERQAYIRAELEQLGILDTEPHGW